MLEHFGLPSFSHVKTSPISTSYRSRTSCNCMYMGKVGVWRGTIYIYIHICVYMHVYIHAETQPTFKVPGSYLGSGVEGNWL